MNVYKLAKKHAAREKAKRTEEVARRTENFIKVIDEWSCFYEQEECDQAAQAINHIVIKWAPYCLYVRVEDVSADVIRDTIDKYRARGFDCQLSVDISTFMISSEVILNAIRAEKFSGSVGASIPNVNEDFRFESYIKQKALLSEIDESGHGFIDTIRRDLLKIVSILTEVSAAAAVNEEAMEKIQEKLEDVLAAVKKNK